MAATVNGSMHLTVRKQGRSLVGVKVTNRPPSVVETGDVVVKVHVIVPEAAFKPLESDPITVTKTVTEAEVQA